MEEEQLGERMKSAVLLKPAFKEVVGNEPDLYGPFWIATTLIVIIIASSSIIAFFNTDNGERVKYDFDQIPVAAMLVRPPSFRFMASALSPLT